MASRRDVLLMTGVGITATCVGVILARGVRLGDSRGDEALHAAQFTDLAGKNRTLAEWRSKVLVVNFWATWCAPCRDEIPGFVAIRNKLLPSGVEFVGIAIDQAAKVTAFAHDVQITYPILLTGAEGLDLIRVLGNPSGGLPFSVILDRAGHVANRHLGLLRPAALEGMLAPLLT